MRKVFTSSSTHSFLLYLYIFFHSLCSHFILLLLSFRWHLSSLSRNNTLFRVSSHYDVVHTFPFILISSFWLLPMFFEYSWISRQINIERWNETWTQYGLSSVIHYYFEVLRNQSLPMMYSSDDQAHIPCYFLFLQRVKKRAGLLGLFFGIEWLRGWLFLQLKFYESRERKVVPGNLSIK